MSAPFGNSNLRRLILSTSAHYTKRVLTAENYFSRPTKCIARRLVQQKRRYYSTDSGSSVLILNFRWQNLNGTASMFTFERLSSPRSMLRYVILLTSSALHDCCTLTSTANFGKALIQPFYSSSQGIQQTFRSVPMYQNSYNCKSQQESMWVAKIMDHSTTCTHSYSY